MISKKSWIADGIDFKFLSEFIIRGEQYCRVYAFVYDDTLNPDGSEDVLQTPSEDWAYPGNLYKRGTTFPKAAEDLIALDKWDLVNNNISFYDVPIGGTTIYIETATTPEEFGDTLVQPSVEKAETAASDSLASANDSATSASASSTSASDASASASSASDSAAAAAIVTKDRVGYVATISALPGAPTGNETTAINVEGYYTSGDGGGGLFNYDATQSAVDNGGTIINGWVRQYSGTIDVKWFGAVGDGETDDSAAVQNACDVLKTAYPSRQSSELFFPSNNDEIYALSGGISLPYCKVTGNEARIKPIGNPDYIFKLDMRFNTNTGRFTNNWLFNGFKMYTDRGFGVPTPVADCGHLLIIDGGWLIRSEISNIEVDPGFACNSLIHWDLTHSEVGIDEVGVPDGIEFKNISAQYSENTSYTISFEGDTLGTGSRVGSTLFQNIYNSVNVPYDFNTRATGTNDFGVIRVAETKIGRATFSEVYGYNPIVQIDGASIVDSVVENLYVEFNHDKATNYECIFRDGVYENTIFNNLHIYTENSNLQAAPRFFDAEFHDCVFHRIGIRQQSQITSAMDANSINLGASSSGNTMTTLPYITVQPSSYGTPYLFTKISVPKDTKILFAEPTVYESTTYTEITANGTYLLASLDSDDAQLNSDIDVSFKVYPQGSSDSADFSILIDGLGFGNTLSSVTRSVAGNDVKLRANNVDVKVVGRNDLVLAPTATQFSTNSTATISVDNGTETDIVTRDDLQIQYNSGSQDISVVVSNIVGTLKVAAVVMKKGYSTGYITKL